MNLHRGHSKWVTPLGSRIINQPSLHFKVEHSTRGLIYWLSHCSLKCAPEVGRACSYKRWKPRAGKPRWRERESHCQSQALSLSCHQHGARVCSWDCGIMWKVMITLKTEVVHVLIGRDMSRVLMVFVSFLMAFLLFLLLMYYILFGTVT